LPSSIYIIFFIQLHQAAGIQFGGMIWS